MPGVAICGKEDRMKRWRWLLLGGCLLGVAGCDYQEVEIEIGYKGEARRNPWLAAERMVAQYGHEVESLTGWRAPEAGPGHRRCGSRNPRRVGNCRFSQR